MLASFLISHTVRCNTFEIYGNYVLGIPGKVRMSRIIIINFTQICVHEAAFCAITHLYAIK